MFYMLTIMVVVGLIFLQAWFVQLSWNYSFPYVMQSVNPLFERSMFIELPYFPALVFVLLIHLLFGGRESSQWVHNFMKDDIIINAKRGR